MKWHLNKKKHVENNILQNNEIGGKATNNTDEAEIKLEQGNNTEKDDENMRKDNKIIVELENNQNKSIGMLQKFEIFRKGESEEIFYEKMKKSFMTR